MTMSNPLTWLLCSILLASFSAFIYWLLAQIKELKVCSKDMLVANAELATRIERDFAGIRGSISDKTTALETKIYDNVVHEKDCSNKRELWDEKHNHIIERMDAFLKQNSIDHAQIIQAMIDNSKRQTDQIAELAETIVSLEGCVKNLELGKEC